MLKCERVCCGVGSVLGCGEGKGERCGGVEKCLRCGGR